MGLLDFARPDNYGLMGLIQGLGQAGMPSRLPVPFGAAMGMGLQGLMQGQQYGRQVALTNQELQRGEQGLAVGNLGLMQSLAAINYYRQRNGLRPVTMKDLASSGPGGKQTFGLSSNAPNGDLPEPVPSPEPIQASSPQPATPVVPGAQSEPAPKLDNLEPAVFSTSEPPPAPPPQHQAAAPITLADAGSALHRALGVPVQITSGLRTAAHNAEVGGVPNSAHLTGSAVDFVPQGMAPSEAVQQLANSGTPFDQLIDEGTHVHMAWGGRQRGQVLVKTAQGYQDVTRSVRQPVQAQAPQEAPAQEPAPAPAFSPEAAPDPLAGIDQIGLFNPQAALQAEMKFMEPQNLRPGGSVAAYNPQTRRYEQYYYQPQLPPGTHIVDGQIVEYPGATQAAARQSYATASGTQRAEAQFAGPIAAAKEAGTKGVDLRFNPAIAAGEAAGRAAVEDAHTLVDVYDPLTQQTIKVPRAQVLGAASPVASTAPGALAAPGPAPQQKLTTTTGIPIPRPPMMQQSGPLAAGPSAGDAATQKAGAKTVETWFDNLPQNVQAEQRFMAMADALKQIQSGAWTEHKAEISRHLLASGLDKGMVNGLLQADPAQAQIILKNNFGAALNSMRGITNRVTQNEIFAAQKNLANPDLEPAANLAIIAQGVGIARYNQALANDWLKAKQAGWSDPLQYQSWWMSQPKNSLQNFIGQAEKDIGPLKGMPVPKSGQLPANARMKLKQGVVTTFANGQQWTLQNGQPVRVQ